MAAGGVAVEEDRDFVLANVGLLIRRTPPQGHGNIARVSSRNCQSSCSVHERAIVWDSSVLRGG